MSFSARVLNVMIASPNDVKEEREIVTNEIHRWNAANAGSRGIVLLPIKWETHTTPTLGDSPQSIINRSLLDDADIVIGIFGTRIGTPTEEFASGTVEEIKRHAAAGKTVKVYFSDVAQSPSTIDQAQYASVVAFRDDIKNDGLYATYSTLEGFKTEFGHHLNIELNNPRYRWLPQIESNIPAAAPELSADAKRMLKSVIKTESILIFQPNFGLSIGDEQFTDGTQKSVARWKAALKELLNAQALEQTGEDIYEVTHYGYEIGGQGKIDHEIDETPFVKEQQNHLLNLLRSCRYQQRDFLRLLLLKGGTVQGRIVSYALQPGTPLNWNELCTSLKNNGLLQDSHDPLSGTSTATVTPALRDLLQALLFPRENIDKDDQPYFRFDGL